MGILDENPWASLRCAPGERQCDAKEERVCSAAARAHAGACNWWKVGHRKGQRIGKLDTINTRSWFAWDLWQVATVRIVKKDDLNLISVWTISWKRIFWKCNRLSRRKQRWTYYIERKFLYTALQVCQWWQILRNLHRNSVFGNFWRHTT